MQRAILLAVIALTLPGCVTQDSRPALCANIMRVSYWTKDWPFVDLMKSASNWRMPTPISQHEAYVSGKVKLDERGWPYTPGEDFVADEEGTPFFRVAIAGGNEKQCTPADASYNPLPVGAYTFIAEGTGVVKISGGGFAETTVECRGGVTTQKVMRGEGKAVFSYLDIVASDSDDHVRNIRLIMPSFEKTYEKEPFHPVFVENMLPFAKYRLMDWSAVNGNPIERWEQRTPANWYSYMSLSRVDIKPGRKPGRSHIGHVPYEVVCQLANKLKRDIWVCVPPMVDDDYVRNMAKLFKEQLDPSIALTVEYANETFNAAFLVYGYTMRMGEEVYGSGNKKRDQARFQVKRVMEIAKIWNDVYGYKDGENHLDDPKRRLRHVLPGHLLPTYRRDADACRVKFDHVIGNFYFGIQFPKQMVANNWLDKDVDFLFAEMAKGLETDKALLKLFRQVAETRDFSEKVYPMTFVTYEGGSHFHDIWWNKDLQAKTGKLTAAMKELPGLYDVYMRLFDLMEQKGLVWDNYIFTIVASGFGHKRYVTQPVQDAPKYRACLDYIKGRRKP
jgi:hypothetical protein